MPRAHRISLGLGGGSVLRSGESLRPESALHQTSLTKESWSLLGALVESFVRGTVHRMASLQVTYQRETLHCMLHLLKGGGDGGREGRGERESAHYPEWYPVSGKLMFAMRRYGDQQQYFMIS